MQALDEAAGASQAEQAAPAHGTAGKRAAGQEGPQPAGIQPARRAAAWGKQKYAGPIGMIFAMMTFLIATGVVIILGAVAGLVPQERGLSSAAAFRKLRRAS